MKPPGDIFQPIRKWRGWRHITTTRVVGALLLIVAGCIAAARYAPRWDEQTADEFIIHILTDILSVVLAVLVIDALGERRANRERKRAIIQQMDSPVLETALEAVRLAKVEGWHEDGSLRGAHLFEANLQGAVLSVADLQEARLFEANLQWANLSVTNLRGATLSGANLQGANLSGANLHGAALVGANLQGASLSRANLYGAHLSGANLQWAALNSANLHRATLHDVNLREADLSKANLQEADLHNAAFDESTTLPDGAKWTRETSMTRFTDPNHPDFWRSDDARSPAYRGGQEPG